MITCAIDPGLKGAIAFIDADMKAGAFAMPIHEDGAINTDRVRDILRMYTPASVVLETPIAMPGLSSTSLMTAGINWGRVYESLVICGYPIVRVAPRAWASKLGAPKDIKGAARKKWNIGKCRELFPDVTIKASEDGKADALLMAYLRMRGTI